MNLRLPAYLKSLFQRQFVRSDKEQTQTIGHWGLLLFFALMIYASLTHQLLLLLLLIGVTAFVKGPLLVLWGSFYSALIAFFPPLAILLSLLFLALNIKEGIRNWRITILGAFFYLFPLLSRLGLSFAPVTDRWVIFLLLIVGVFSLHFLLQKLYRWGLSSRFLFWSILSLPYELVLFLMPAKFRRFKKSNQSFR